MSVVDYYKPLQGESAHVTVMPVALEGEFLREPFDFQRAILLASLGQSVLATPKGLAKVWTIEPRVVAKALSNLSSILSVEGTGYVRRIEVEPSLIQSSCEAGTTPDISCSVQCGWSLPDGPVSLWRGRGLSRALRAAVFTRDGKVCAYCKTTQGKFHIDHIVPVAKGGTDDLENLTVACAGCNLSKSDLSLEQWKEKQDG